jgi:hypothetical protein
VADGFEVIAKPIADRSIIAGIKDLVRLGLPRNDFEITRLLPAPGADFPISFTASLTSLSIAGGSQSQSSDSAGLKFSPVTICGLNPG